MLSHVNLVTSVVDLADVFSGPHIQGTDEGFDVLTMPVDFRLVGLHREVEFVVVDDEVHEYDYTIETMAFALAQPALCIHLVISLFVATFAENAFYSQVRDVLMVYEEMDTVCFGVMRIAHIVVDVAHLLLLVTNDAFIIYVQFVMHCYTRHRDREVLSEDVFDDRLGLIGVGQGRLYNLLIEYDLQIRIDLEEHRVGFGEILIVFEEVVGVVADTRDDTGCDVRLIFEGPLVHISFDIGLHVVAVGGGDIFEMVIVLGEDDKVTVVLRAELGQCVYDALAELIVSTVIVGETVFQRSADALERLAVVLDAEVAILWIEEIVLCTVIENRNIDSRYLGYIQSVGDEFVCCSDRIHNGCAFVLPV